MEQQRTTLEAVTRTSFLLNLTGGLALLGLGAYLGYQGWSGAGGWYWAGAIPVGLFGLVTALGSTMTSAPCPACGDKHWAITADEYETCSACDVYLQGDTEAIWLVDDEHIAEEPVFKVELNEDGFYWPEGCCVCGEEATRVVEVEFSDSHTGRNIALAAAGLAAGALIVRTGGGASNSVEMPHCDEHDDGGSLAKDGVLRLRSHSFYKRFIERNAKSTDDAEREAA